MSKVDDLEYIIKYLFPKLSDGKVFVLTVVVYVVLQALNFIFCGACLYLGLILCSKLFE